MNSKILRPLSLLVAAAVIPLLVVNFFIVALVVVGPSFLIQLFVSFLVSLQSLGILHSS